ncbi:hypothetical protein [Bradyrhizobium sp. LA2.1]|uniref:hypothetical protein n=1 Tax=Bradyrhizobium sp. LA2.1 TaxID=3156376 RepID=UPI00339A490F
MKTSAEILAEIDAFDARVWASLNIDSNERPSTWLDYTFDEQLALEHQRREQLCEQLAEAIEAGTKQ